MKYFQRVAIDRILLFTAFITAAVYSFRRMSDTDLWAHLKCGEYFWRNGAILKTYLFNCSWPGFPYVNHEWLFQAVIYGIQAASGEPGLIALQVLLVILSFFILYRILRLITDNLGLISIILVLGIMASSHRFSLRPQHFSYVFLLYFLFSLHQYQRGVRLYAWFMPLVMMLWVNMHAECLWGIMVPAFFIAGEYFKSMMKKCGSDVPLKPIVIIYGLIVAASLINPFTYKTVIWPLLVMKEQFAGVEEILPPLGLKYLFFWVYLFVFIASTTVNLKRVDLTWLILSLVFAAIALTANRGIPHFVFLSAPVIVANLDGLFTRFSTSFSPHATWRPGLNLALTLMILALLVSIVTSPRYFRGYDKVFYPEDALAFLNAQGVQGNVISEHLWGGFIIWNAYPRLKPYIDGRFFHKKFYDEFFPLLAGNAGWEEVLAPYDISIALLKYSENDNGRLNDRLFLSPHWRLVYWDDGSLLYLKETDANRKVIEHFGNNLVNPDRQLLADYEGRTRAFILSAQKAIEPDLRIAVRSYKARILSANISFALKDYPSALRKYEDALHFMDEGNAWVYFKIAGCYRNTGDLINAEKYLKKAMNLAPDAEIVRQMLREVQFLRGNG